MAVIVGARTGKIIYAGTRNKSCVTCDKNQDKIPPHKCYKTWSEPPNGMESDNILSGFQSSIETYELVYNKFIGDGNFSVHAKIIIVYGDFQVEKIECMNHVLRNLTSKLLDISKDQVKGINSAKIPLDERKLFNPFVKRFRTDVKSAILYNNKNGKDWKALRSDLLNIPAHIFGEHTHCRTYFCTGPKIKPDGQVENNVYKVAATKVFFKPLMTALGRVADLSKSLIDAKTSNPAELFMSVASKVVEGKRKHFGQRNLYNIRMQGAVLSYNGSLYCAKIVLKLISDKRTSRIIDIQESREIQKRLVKKAVQT